MATDRQQRAYDIVREHHTLTVVRVNRRNSALPDALRPVPKFAVGSWAWVYNSVATIRQGSKPDTDAKTLKAKLSLNWTGPYKVLVVGPCSSANTPDGSPLEAKLLYLDLPVYQVCPALMLAGAYRFNAASPGPAPTTVATSRVILPAGLTQYTAQQLLQEISPVPRHPGRRFDPFSTARSRKKLPDTDRFEVEVASSR